MCFASMHRDAQAIFPFKSILSSTLNPIKAYLLGISDGEVMIFPNSSKAPGRCRGWLGSLDCTAPPRAVGVTSSALERGGQCCFGWQRTRGCGWKLSWNQHQRAAAIQIFLEQRHKQATGIYCGAFAASTGGNLLQIKPLTFLAILCSCRSTGVEMLCSCSGCFPCSHFGRAAWLLNIYWTFSLMPTTWEMSHMMGVKAKANFSCKRLA